MIYNYSCCCCCCWSTATAAASGAFFGIMMNEAVLLVLNSMEKNDKVMFFHSINSIKKSWNAFQSSRWREMLFGESQQDICEDILNLKSEFAFSIRFRTRSNECSGPTINMMLSHFVTITQDLYEKHSTDPNECIRRFTFLFEGASLFVIVI